MGTSIEELIGIVLSGQENSVKGVERIDYTEKYPIADILKAVQAVGMSKVGNFTIDTENRFAYENFARWLLGDKAMTCHNPNGKQGDVKGDLTKGVYLCSKTGRGKTVLTDVMLHICKKLLLGYKYRGGLRALAWTSRRADEIVNDFSNGKDCLRLYVDECPVLCIQDLGTETAEGVYMGNKVEIIKAIIEARADSPQCITIITSNIPLWQQEVITQKYGTRVLSRLTQLNYIQLAGPDRRTIKSEVG